MKLTHIIIDTHLESGKYIKLHNIGNWQKKVKKWWLKLTRGQLARLLLQRKTKV